MGNENYKINQFTFNVESVTAFLHLLQEEQWEEQLNRFISSEGMHFVSICEGWDVSSLRKSMKEIRKSKDSTEFPKKKSPWHGMWDKGGLIQDNYTLLKETWDEIVVTAFLTVKEFLPSWNQCEGICFFVPGGSKEIYCTENKCAINLGLERHSEPEWRFTIANQIFKSHLLWILRRQDHTNGDIGNLKPVESLLSALHREGIAAYVGIQAAGDSELTDRYSLTNEDVTRYTSTIHKALEEPTFTEKDIDSDTALMQSTTRIGLEMARVIDESGMERGHTMGREMLVETLSFLGFLSFIQHYKIMDPDVFNMDTIWKACTAVKKKRKVHLVKEDVFYYR